LCCRLQAWRHRDEPPSFRTAQDCTSKGFEQGSESRSPSLRQ
jgi:hypothetical protein